ncbi:MAG: hypothetical protein QF432_04535 [Dehalococcoidales bacterium]|jgi:hypothetical protein|nr:hypothetical protein [Dehalococcoidales bacterium]
MSKMAGGYKSPHSGFRELVSNLPSASRDFEGTDLGQPAALAYLGEKANLSDLVKEAKELANAAPERVCEPAMIMAEIIEASSPDWDKYFITDERTRGRVFMGSKWRSGWIFIMGGGDHAELAQKFGERDFLVFAQNGEDLDKVVDLGPRETAGVYFLQLMVRYAMTWADIRPGDDHEMGYFLEKDMPGVVVADGDLTPVEELLLLGLMKMGAPAVVPGNYPWELGRQIRAEGADNIIDAAIKFPNLRVKDIQGKATSLPDFCDKANISAKFKAKSSIGGKDSFFVLMPGNVKQGMDLPQNNDLSDCDEIGITVEIGDKRLDISTSEHIEKEALKGISSIKGYRAEISEDGGFLIKCAGKVKPDASMIAEAVSKWVQFEFPYIENVRVSIITGEEVRKTKKMAETFKAERGSVIENESDDTVQYFHYCLECQPFSKDHVCIITPDRPPMCGRDRLLSKAAALFGASWHPWKRRDLEDQNIRGIIEVKAAKDTTNGEYREVNQVLGRLSPGNIKRVQLHGLREFPHTSCGCFQYLTFWIESLNGFGIIERNYAGEAPEGLTWNILANAAGGKQTPGIIGTSKNYLLSKRYMQGEGGFESLRWASPKAMGIVKDRLPDNNNVLIGT